MRAAEEKRRATAAAESCERQKVYEERRAAAEKAMEEMRRSHAHCLSIGMDASELPPLLTGTVEERIAYHKQRAVAAGRDEMDWLPPENMDEATWAECWTSKRPPRPAPPASEVAPATLAGKAPCAAADGATMVVDSAGEEEAPARTAGAPTEETSASGVDESAAADGELSARACCIPCDSGASGVLDTSRDGAHELSRGERIRVCGLEQQTELNDKCGHALRWISAQERCVRACELPISAARYAHPRTIGHCSLPRGSRG